MKFRDLIYEVVKRDNDDDDDDILSMKNLTSTELKKLIKSNPSKWKKYEIYIPEMQKLERFMKRIDNTKSSVDTKKEVMSAEEKQVGKTIIQQMGGFNRLKVMLGFKNIVITKTGITIQGFKGSPKYNYCDVDYNYGKDSYDMTFYRFDIGKAKLGKRNKKIFDDIYFDQLNDIFEEETGVRLSL